MWLNLEQQDVDKAVKASQVRNFLVTESCPVFQCINRYFKRKVKNVSCETVLFKGKGQKEYVLGGTARRIALLNTKDWPAIIPGRIYVKGLELGQK